METLIKHNKTKQIYIDGFDKSQRNNTLRKKREIKGNEISALVIVVVVIGFLFLKSNKTMKLIETDKYKSLAQKKIERKIHSEKFKYKKTIIIYRTYMSIH